MTKHGITVLYTNNYSGHSHLPAYSPALQFTGAFRDRTADVPMYPDVVAQDWCAIHTRGTDPAEFYMQAQAYGWTVVPCHRGVHLLGSPHNIYAPGFFELASIGLLTVCIVLQVVNRLIPALSALEFGEPPAKIP